MRRWTSWAWGGNCDKPTADDLSTRLGADATGLDRAQAEETPTSTSAAPPLKRLADISNDAAVAAHESVNNFLTLAQDTDMLCFQP